MKTPIIPTLLAGTGALIAAECGPQSLADSVSLVGTRKAAVLEPIAEELQQWLTAEGP
ncbi:MAG: hypothetical protein ACOC2D_02785 [Spirochaetota bacterium]